MDNTNTTGSTSTNMATETPTVVFQTQYNLLDELAAAAYAGQLDASANWIGPVPVSPPSDSPPVTPPPLVREPAMEPPALLRRRMTHLPDTESDEEGAATRQFVRTFRAERAGSDTESDDEEEETLPVPTSPLQQQIAYHHVISDEEADAETEEEAEVEQQQGTPETIIPIPAWLFATTFVAMVIYLLFIIYLLTAQCKIPIRV